LRVQQRVARLGRLLTAGMLFVLPMLNVQPASAATITWDGGSVVDGNWSRAENWAGDVLPVDGDSLVFPSGAARLTNTNDMGGTLTTIETVTISGDAYTIGGNALTITPVSSIAIQFTGTNNAWDIDTTISATASKSIYSSETGNVVSGDLALSVTGGQMNFGSDAGDSLSITGVISGSTDGVVISPDSTVTFNAANTFVSASTTISAGSEFICQNTDCLGVSNVQILMYEDAQLTLNGTANLVQDIQTNIPFPATPAVIYDYGNSTLSGDITIDAPLTVRANAGVTTTLSGNITFTDSAVLTLVGSGDPGADVIDQNGGIISGSGGGIVVDGVRAILNGNNTYEGTTTVNNQGVIELNHNNALGSATDKTIVNSTGTVYAALATAVPEDFDIEGSGATNWTGALELDGALDVELSGDIALLGDATIANSSANDTLNLSGVISGTGNLTLTQTNYPAHIRFSGSAANTYAGTTTVNAAYVELDKDNNVVAIPGNVIVLAGATYDSFLETLAEQQIADDANILLTNNPSQIAGLVIALGHTEIIGALRGDGEVQIDGNRLVTRFSGNHTFSGTIAGPGVLNKEGTGTLTLSGAFIDNGGGYPSAVEVHEGKVVVDPTNSSFEQAAWTINGGDIGGTGSIGPTTMGGTGSFAPGNSPGCLDVNGNLTFSATNSFDVELGGTTQCSGYDHTAVSGTAALTGASLEVSHYGGFTPAVGNTFTIINAASISGTFNGLSDGSTLTVGLVTYRINYASTTVILTVTNIASATNLADTGVPIVANTLLPVVLIALTLGLARRKKLGA
jgi:fibronectin-binding autotransporter adhesin